MTRPLLTEADRADAFRGLAHPLRRRVLTLLKQKERTVGELLDHIGGGQSMPSLSRHLRVLNEAGLIQQRKQGPHRIYRLHRPALQKSGKWLNQLL